MICEMSKDNFFHYPYSYQSIVLDTAYYKKLSNNSIAVQQHRRLMMLHLIRSAVYLFIATSVFRDRQKERERERERESFFCHIIHNTLSLFQLV